MNNVEKPSEHYQLNMCKTGNKTGVYISAFGTLLGDEI